MTNELFFDTDCLSKFSLSKSKGEFMLGLNEEFENLKSHLVISSLEKEKDDDHA